MEEGAGGRQLRGGERSGHDHWLKAGREALRRHFLEQSGLFELLVTLGQTGLRLSLSGPTGKS